jgi:very-short-patch-repair endonuclease
LPKRLITDLWTGIIGGNSPSAPIPALPPGGGRGDLSVNLKNGIMSKLRGGEDYPIYFGAKPELLRIAGDLRHSLTSSERLLWEKLRNRKILGFKFRRQHPFNEIILDFYCHDARLSVEIDGNIHNDQYQKERDKERTYILSKFGITEVRFSNREVENQIEKVLEKIKEYLVTLPPSPGRGKGRDGG